MRKLLIAAAAAAALIASSSPAAADMKIDVEPGFDGFVPSGGLAPVRVRVESDRLLKGTLRAHAGSDPVQAEIEVPGGSVKQYVVPVAFTSQSSQVWITLHDSKGRTVARSTGQQVTVIPAETELVGLLPGVLGSRPVPGTAPLAVDAGVARFVRLDAKLLEDPESLRSLAAIGAAPDDLDRLGEEAAEALRRWTAEGGTLLFDGRPGEIPGFPKAWHPTGAAPVEAGLGRVKATSGAMRAGRFDRLVEPSARGGIERAPDGQNFFNGLLIDLGARTTRVATLIIPLAIYAVLAGPLLYLLLRRKRRETAVWIALPAVAVALTAASYLGALTVRGGGRASHMSLITSTAGGASAYSSVAVTTPGGGEVSVEFPDGWTPAYASHDDRFGYLAGSPLPAEPILTDAGWTGRMAVNPGQARFASATGPAPEAGRGLRVSTRNDGKRISGTVHNDTPWTLAESAVIVGKDHVALGRLEPGDRRPWGVAAEPGNAHFSLPGPDLWGQMLGDASSAVSYDIWRLAGARLGPDVIGTGHAVAVGWTRDYTPEVSIEGIDAAPRGRTLVMGRATIGGPAAPLAVVREQVRGAPLTDVEPGHDELGIDDPIMLRFARSAPGKAVKLRAPENTSRIEVWTGTEWDVAFEAPSAAPMQTPGPGLQVRPIPHGHGYSGPQFGPGHPSGPEVAMTDHELAVTGQVVYVRVTQDPSSGLHSAWAFTLSEVP